MGTNTDFSKTKYIIGRFIVQHEHCRQNGATLSIDKEIVTCSFCDKIYEPRSIIGSSRRPINLGVRLMDIIIKILGMF